MVAPAIVAAILSAIGSVAAAGEASKGAAAQGAAGAAAGKLPNQFEPIKPQFMTLQDSNLNLSGEPRNAENPSAYGRKLEDLNQPMEIMNNPGKFTLGATMPEVGDPPKVEGIPGSLDPNSGVPPALDPNYTEPAGKPPAASGGEGFMGMNGMDLAMLGLTLGSMLSQRKPGPPPPGLPGNSFSPMRPVFRG